VVAKDQTVIYYSFIKLPAAIGFVHYCKGTWKQYGDNLLLNFEEKKPGLPDQKIIIKDKILHTAPHNKIKENRKTVSGL